jgi:hypothetical protein
MGEKPWKSLVFLISINGSKGIARMWNIMKRVAIQELREAKKMLKKFWCIHIDI